MSTIVQILKETEIILPTKVAKALYRERRERLARASRHDPRLSHAQTGTPYGNARDTDMGRPEVRVIGRAPQSTKPIQSAKSKIVPEPDQVQSKRPNPRMVTGPLEPQG